MLDFNEIVVKNVQNIFSRPIVVTPYGSQPGAPSYNARGVFVTGPVDVLTEGAVVFSDQRTACDIRLSEYGGSPPGVRDHIYFPPCMSAPEQGPFEVQDIDPFYDGRARLSLRLVVDDNPRPFQPPRP